MTNFSNILLFKGRYAKSHQWNDDLFWHWLLFGYFNGKLLTPKIIEFNYKYELLNKSKKKMCAPAFAPNEMRDDQQERISIVLFAYEWYIILKTMQNSNRTCMTNKYQLRQRNNWDLKIKCCLLLLSFSFYFQQTPKTMKSCDNLMRIRSLSLGW